MLSGNYFDEKAVPDEKLKDLRSVLTVVNGRVILTGIVSSNAVKQRAERLAYSVKGVLGVDNKITVTPSP